MLFGYSMRAVDVGITQKATCQCSAWKNKTEWEGVAFSAVQGLPIYKQ